MSKGPKTLAVLKYYYSARWPKSTISCSEKQNEGMISEDLIVWRKNFESQKPAFFKVI